MSLQTVVLPVFQGTSKAGVGHLMLLEELSACGTVPWLFFVDPQAQVMVKDGLRATPAHRL